MIGKAYVAILTLRHPAAGTTLHHRSKPTTVLKENHLFFLFQSLFHILYQKWRELSDHPLFAMQFLDIHRNNLRQLDFFISFFQLYETIFPSLAFCHDSIEGVAVPNRVLAPYMAASTIAALRA